MLVALRSESGSIVPHLRRSVSERPVPHGHDHLMFVGSEKVGGTRTADALPGRATSASTIVAGPVRQAATPYARSPEPAGGGFDRAAVVVRGGGQLSVDLHQTGSVDIRRFAASAVGSRGRRPPVGGARGCALRVDRGWWRAARKWSLVRPLGQRVGGRRAARWGAARC